MEEELLQACRNGDQSAYESLVSMHMGAVFGICVSMLGNVHDAEDATQETFVRAFHQLKELRSGGQFRAWIGRIARNLCLDLLRRRKRGQEVLSMHGATAKHEDQSGASLHEAQMLRQEDRQRLEQALARLPEKYRLPLLLYYYDGHSTDSVAERLQLDPAGVLTRLSRARKGLRRLLGEHGGSL